MSTPSAVARAVMMLHQTDSLPIGGVSPVLTPAAASASMLKVRRKEGKNERTHFCGKAVDWTNVRLPKNRILLL
jgi:hypothetical protein